MPVITLNTNDEAIVVQVSRPHAVLLLLLQPPSQHTSFINPFLRAQSHPCRLARYLRKPKWYGVAALIVEHRDLACACRAIHTAMPYSGLLCDQEDKKQQRIALFYQHQTPITEVVSVTTPVSVTVTPVLSFSAKKVVLTDVPAESVTVPTVTCGHNLQPLLVGE